MKAFENKVVEDRAKGRCCGAGAGGRGRLGGVTWDIGGQGEYSLPEMIAAWERYVLVSLPIAVLKYPD